MSVGVLHYRVRSDIIYPTRRRGEVEGHQIVLQPPNPHPSTAGSIKANTDWEKVGGITQRIGESGACSGSAACWWNSPKICPYLQALYIVLHHISIIFFQYF